MLIEPAPPDNVLRRLEEGYCLVEHELDQLRSDASAAKELEAVNPDFAREAKQWRADRDEEEKIKKVCPAQESRDDLVRSSCFNI
eukprot:scaffold243899_cov37-Tisochrysis_lutea.AAC.1